MELTIRERVSLIDAYNKEISIKRQAELLEISRATVYYELKVNKEDIILMNKIDEQYTKTPFYGSRKMKVILNQNGYNIGRRKVQSLMRKMGIEAIYPKKNLSKAEFESRKYPYLLRNMIIEEVNKVWGTDITYIRMCRGWLYLVAIMDWYSRYVLSWELSTILEADFCIEAIDKAFKVAKPEIINSDQGSQYTSLKYIERVEKENIKISMDGRGRCMDNIFTERLWGSLKREEVYLKEYYTINDARKGINEYFYLYNNERPHQSLNYYTPVQIYYAKNKDEMKINNITIREKKKQLNPT